MKFDSTVERWPGYIETEDVMRYPALIAWDSALTDASRAEDQTNAVLFYGKLLPVAIPMVKEWHIEGLADIVTYDNFPASPLLVAWLVECITKLFQATNAVPDPKLDAQ